jgi:dolichol-phosphate mannosyltransferase
VKTAIVLPTYNERERLGSVAQAILSLDLPLELIVVDDASPDGTGHFADAMAGRDRRLHVVHRRGARSYAGAVLEGFRVALKGECDCVVTMDADGSHDPQCIPDLVQAAEQFDLVLGSRYVDGLSVVNWSLPKVMASYAANTYVRIVTGLRFMDATSGFRAYRREVLEAIGTEGIMASGYAFLIEMAYRSHRLGFRVGETPIIFYGRHSRRSRLAGPTAVLGAALHTVRLRTRPVPPARRQP